MLVQGRGRYKYREEASIENSVGFGISRDVYYV